MVPHVEICHVKLFMYIYKLRPLRVRNSFTFSLWVFDLLGLPSLCLF